MSGGVTPRSPTPSSPRRFFLLSSWSPTRSSSRLAEPQRRAHRRNRQLRRPRELQRLLTARSFCQTLRIPSSSRRRRWRQDRLRMALALLLFRIGRFKRLIRGPCCCVHRADRVEQAVWWWMFEPLYSVVNWTLKSCTSSTRHPLAARPVPGHVHGWSWSTTGAVCRSRHHHPGRPGRHPARAVRGAESDGGRARQPLLAHHGAAAQARTGRGHPVLRHLHARDFNIVTSDQGGR